MKRSVIMLALLALSSVPSAVRADERKFGYSYQADSVLPKGGREFEQWITLRNDKAGGEFRRWDFREELEFGVTDRYTTSAYLNFQNIHSQGVPGQADSSATKFEGVSWENKYMLVSPNTHPVGLAPYFEATVEEDELEFEEKLLLQANLGEKVKWVGNITLEQEFEREDGETEEEGVLELTTGLSYAVSPHWSVAVEGRNHREFPGSLVLEKQEHSAWFAGPTVSYANGSWWGLLSVLPQVAGSPATRKGLQLEEHEKLEIRILAGFSF